MKRNRMNPITLIVVLSILMINFSAWFTHVIACIKTEQLGFLIAGAVAFPVAIVHGIGIWFGFWV